MEDTFDPLNWDLLGEVFTAETVMTPTEQLLRWADGEDRDTIIKKAKEDNYDIIPIVSDNKINGLILSKSGEEQPLSSEWLISHTTAIPDLFDLFIHFPKPGFFVLKNQDVVGLVTPADLNKLPARVFIYNLIGELEIELARAVEEFFDSNPKSILSNLSKERRLELNSRFKDLREGDVDLSVVQIMDLSDLINIVTKSVALREKLGILSRNEFKKLTRGLVDLRNRTMHVVCPLIMDVDEDLARLHRRMKRAHNLLSILGKDPSGDEE